MLLPLFVKLSIILSALALAACARTAPALPPDRTESALAEGHNSNVVSADIQALSCSDIRQEMSALEQHDQMLEQKIQSHRHTNQRAAFFGGFLFPPVLLNDAPAKALLDQNQERRDQLIVVSKDKRCPTVN